MPPIAKFNAQMRDAHCRACALLMLFAVGESAGGQTLPSNTRFPFPEKLTYLVEWRMIDAGTATVELARDTAGNGWNFNVDIQSAGLVSRLFRVSDSYKVAATDHFCLKTSILDANEGKKHVIAKMSLDNSRKKLLFEEHDFLKNSTEKKELEVAACTYEIAGALASLRTLNIEPGHSTVLAMTDGKRFAHVRLAAEGKEKLSLGGGKNYETTRYQGFMFDNVLYKRRGRLLIWISDDPDHIPVQFRLLMGFPVGTITISLQKQERKQIRQIP